MRKVLFLAPQLYGTHGGVQTFMRRIREVLNDYALAQGVLIDCVSLNDPAQADLAQHPRSVDATSFYGCSGSKVRFLQRALRLVLKQRYDIAIVGHIGQSPVAQLLKTLGLIRSFAVVLHGVEAWQRLPPIELRAAKQAKVIVATTKYTSRIFCGQNQIPPDRCRILPLAVEASKKQIALRAPLTTYTGDNGFSILSVGRLDTSEPGKGVDITIQALSKIKSAVGSIHLLVVGDGDDRTRLERLVQYLRLEQSVTFLGAVDSETLHRAYQKCDLFVLPSRQEGFGFAFLEAMSYGKPCIGGNHGGIPEVIDHDRTGFLLDFGNVDGLAEQVIRLAEDKTCAQQLGQAGFKKVLDQYCYETFSENLLAVVEELISA